MAPAKKRKTRKTDTAAAGTSATASGDAEGPQPQPPTFSAEVKKSLSCGLCDLVPGGKIYFCVKGQHSVCEECYVKSPSSCPQHPCNPSYCYNCGGYRSYELPVQNNVQERTIAALGIPVSCKYSASDGCEFRGSLTERPDHVKNCAFRKVMCPLPDCRGSITAKDLVAHLKEAHSAPDVEELTAEPISWSLVKCPPPNNAQNWGVNCFTVDGLEFAAIFGKQGLMYHTWVVGLFGPDAAEDFKQSIMVASVKNGTTWASKVFPVGMDPSTIMKDPVCLEMTSKSVAHMATSNEGQLCLHIAYSVDKA